MNGRVMKLRKISEFGLLRFKSLLSSLWSLRLWESKNESGSPSVVSDSSGSHGLQPARLLCSWNSPDKNTGVGCHFLLQRIFLIHGLNLASPALHLSHQGSLSLIPVSVYFYNAYNTNVSLHIPALRKYIHSVHSIITQ